MGAMPKLQLALSHSPQPPMELVGSPEQTTIWHEMIHSRKHLLVNAVAGSGKSTTCIEGAKRVKAHHSAGVLYLAFNKHIQQEMQNRADGWVSARTFHSLGLDAVKARLGAVQIDDRRMWKVIENIGVAWGSGDQATKAGLKQLSALAKQYDVESRGELEQLIDQHGLDLGDEEEQDAVVELMPLVMARASQFTKGQVAAVDFDDMCWLPKRLELQLRPVDIVLVDEAQDLNRVQQWMAVRAGERVMVTGDRNQAIYGFRGSDTTSMDNLAMQCSGPVIELPLTYTRRCPVSHVLLAQKVVPAIQALPDASEGHSAVRSYREVIDTAKPGDMIICRTNAPLIECAHRLMADGKRAMVLGRDVGGQIIRLLEQACNSGRATLKAALEQARVITDHDVNRFLLMENSKGEMRAAMAEDRLQCLLVAAEGCGSVSQLMAKLKEMFGRDEDRSNVITLGSIHKVKGLEADTVTILRPELIPHPRAVRPEELQQELNCLYVALTRSRCNLYFTDQLPALLT